MKPLFVACSLLLLVSCSGSKTDAPQERKQDSIPTSQNPTESVESTPVDTTGFRAFVNLFNVADIEMTEAALGFVGEPIISGVVCNTVANLDSDPVHLLLYVRTEPSGGTGALNAVTFGHDGVLISNTEIANSAPAGEPYGEAKSYTYSYDADRNVILISKSERKWDEEKEEGFSVESLHPYYIDGDGNVKMGRDHPAMSEVILNYAGVAEVQKEDLKFMRNEVFAVYGYIFKTEPLKSHYQAKPWYKGERENVDDLLTDIEKANIVLIKGIEDGQ